MAKEILDIYVEQGYPYDFDLDFNSIDGTDLENDYTCYFVNDSIGSKQFEVINNRYNMVLTSEDTGKLINNLEQYTIYAYEIVTGKKNKLLSGRIHLDGISKGEIVTNLYNYVPGEW